jgi:hypothetical protein
MLKISTVYQSRLEDAVQATYLSWHNLVLNSESLNMVQVCNLGSMSTFVWEYSTNANVAQIPELVVIAVFRYKYLYFLYR